MSFYQAYLLIIEQKKKHRAWSQLLTTSYFLSMSTYSQLHYCSLHRLHVSLFRLFKLSLALVNWQSRIKKSMSNIQKLQQLIRKSL